MERDAAPAAAGLVVATQRFALDEAALPFSSPELLYFDVLKVLNTST